MSRLTRLCVVVIALLSLFAVGAASAGAVTWDNSGNTHFNMTGGTGTLSSTNVNFAVGGWDVTGKTTTPITGAVAPIFDLTMSCTNAVLSGQAVGCECGATFTASSQSGAVTSGPLDMTCGVYLAGIKVCHIEGSVSASYTNPVGSTAGVLTTTTGGSLRPTNAQSNCPLGNNEPTHLSVLTFRVTTGTGGTGTLGPIITRTA